MRYQLLILVTSGVLLAGCDQLQTPVLASAAPTGGTPGVTTPLAIVPNQLQLAVGATAQLTTNASTALQPQVEWLAVQPAIATVSPSGLVTGIAPGTAVVEARFAFDTTQTALATVTVLGAASPGSGSGTGTGGTGG